MKIRVTDVIIRVDGMSFEITGAHDAEVLLLENPFSKGQTLSVRVAKGEMNTLRGAVSEGLADLDAGRREKFTAEKIKAEGRAMLRAGGFPVSEGEASSSSMTGDCAAGAFGAAISGATGIAVGSGPGDLRSVPDGFVLTTRGLMTEDEFLNLLRAKH